MNVLILEIVDLGKSDFIDFLILSEGTIVQL